MIVLSVEKEKQRSSSHQQMARPQHKEVRKERKVLEKKVALSRKRRRDSRCGFDLKPSGVFFVIVQPCLYLLSFFSSLGRRTNQEAGKRTNRKSSGKT